MSQPCEMTKLRGIDCLDETGNLRLIITQQVAQLIPSAVDTERCHPAGMRGQEAAIGPGLASVVQ
jgi:hypothetical protein